ncbi:MAG: type II toxin-antitoxin system death-on-curing family toxin [Methylocystis sp.]
MTDYLTIVEVLAIHEDLIERFGGAAGVRDAGQLEAALFRPQTGYYADLIAQSAALWESLSQNHAFVDGNKRIGFAAMFTFLAINGLSVTADATEAWTFMSGLYETGQFRFDALDAWLRRHTKRTNETDV